ncbi:MAG: hypothetical protein KGS72_24630 [Cyanobacteria bacterium REEB67]|nr:hypothetical protein [Cyanobacteria bacterium REEB67]
MKGQLKTLLTAFTITVASAGRAIALPAPLQNPPLQAAPLAQIPQQTQVIQGVNTAGTVQVNNLAILEAALNFVTNAVEIGGIGLGIFYIMKTLRMKDKTTMRVVRGLSIGALFILMAMAIPGTIAWLFASNRCGSLFAEIFY